MSIKLNEAISKTMHSAIAGQVFPGGVVGYIKGNNTEVLSFGRLTYEPNSPDVTADTVYDLASITKSLPTASIILTLVEKNLLSLNDSILMYIPELQMNGREEILIRHLLTFTAVFDTPDRLSSYANEGRDALLRRIYSTPLKFPPGQQSVYANIPYLLLGMVAERVLKKPLDQIADELFFHPLHMRSTSFHPKTLEGLAIAPTEINERGIVCGDVHDETAWALYKEGQVPGHAGLFSTAGDLLIFSQMLLNQGTYHTHQYFTPAIIDNMRHEVARSDTRGFSLGWATSAAFIPADLPSDCFGKDGFTGTLILMSIDTQECLVLLTNRTYPKRPDNPKAIIDVQCHLANLIFSGA